MNTNPTLKNDESRRDVDVLLHHYFQAELPSPWPTFTAPKALRLKRPVSSWSRYSGRLALAACVALLVAGYLTLGGFFPRPANATGVHQEAPDIASKEKGTKSHHDE